MLGIDGIEPFIRMCMLEPTFVLGSLVVCFSAVQIMLETRAVEQRNRQRLVGAPIQAYAVSHDVMPPKLQPCVGKN